MARSPSQEEGLQIARFQLVGLRQGGGQRGIAAPVGGIVPCRQRQEPRRRQQEVDAGPEAGEAGEAANNAVLLVPDLVDGGNGPAQREHLPQRIANGGRPGSDVQRIGAHLHVFEWTVPHRRKAPAALGRRRQGRNRPRLEYEWLAVGPGPFHVLGKPEVAGDGLAQPRQAAIGRIRHGRLVTGGRFDFLGAAPGPRPDLDLAPAAATLDDAPAETAPAQGDLVGRDKPSDD